MELSLDNELCRSHQPGNLKVMRLAATNREEKSLQALTSMKCFPQSSQVWDKYQFIFIQDETGSVRLDNMWDPHWNLGLTGFHIRVLILFMWSQPTCPGDLVSPFLPACLVSGPWKIGLPFTKWLCLSNPTPPLPQPHSAFMCLGATVWGQGWISLWWNTVEVTSGSHCAWTRRITEYPYTVFNH